MMDVDLLSTEAKLRAETWGVEMSMIVSTIYILNGQVLWQMKKL